MYLAFLDEANHETKNKFTVCGLTAVPIEAIVSLADKVKCIRDEAGVFTPADPLKFNTTERPDLCTPDMHRALKENVLAAAHSHGVRAFIYCKYNTANESEDPTRNRLYGFNTLLGKFQNFLQQEKEHGHVTFDRLDIKSSSYTSGFDYMREKFQKGNFYSQDSTWQELPNIISYSMNCDGTSHLASVCDIVTGAARYLCNGENATARHTIKEQLSGILWKDRKGFFQEHGFTMRPYKRDKLPKDVVVEYDALRAFLNQPADSWR